MAQPLIKFFRVQNKPTTGTPGALYFVSTEGVLYVCTGTSSFEAYAGIKSAALDGSVLTLTPSVGNAISVDIAALAQAAVDLSEYAKTEAVNTAISNAIAAEVERADGAYDEKGAAAAALDSAKAWVEEQKYVTASIINGLATEEYVNSAVKAEADIARGAEKALADRLDIIEGEGEGSIKKAVADAKAAIEGTLADDDARTLEAINDELDTLAARGYKVAEVTEGLPANIERRYRLVDQTGAVIEGSVNIDVEKESALKNVELVDVNDNGVAGNYLKWTYILADGTEKVQYLDVSQLLVEAEFKNGLQVSAGQVSVKVDTDSEKFLTVGEAGVKLSGVQEAINTAVAAKNVTASGDTYVSATVAEGTNHVTVATSEATKASLALADTALQAADITTGAANGTIAVEGEDVAVKGLGDAAYVGLTATPTKDSNDAFTAGGAYLLDGKIDANTAAIGDLSDRIDGLDFGVTSVAASTSSAHVTVAPTIASDGAVTVTVDVASVDAANGEAAGLATDAYVREQVADAALVWQKGSFPAE